MSEDLDALCRAYRHAERRIRHCPNPRCPGRVGAPRSSASASRSEDDVGLLPEELADLDEAPDVTDELAPVTD